MTSLRRTLPLDDAMVVALTDVLDGILSVEVPDTSTASIDCALEALGRCRRLAAAVEARSFPLDDQDLVREVQTAASDLRLDALAERSAHLVSTVVAEKLGAAAATIFDPPVRAEQARARYLAMADSLDAIVVEAFALQRGLSAAADVPALLDVIEQAA